MTPIRPQLALYRLAETDMAPAVIWGKTSMDDGPVYHGTVYFTPAQCKSYRIGAGAQGSMIIRAPAGNTPDTFEFILRSELPRC